MTKVYEGNEQLQALELGDINGVKDVWIALETDHRTNQHFSNLSLYSNAIRSRVKTIVRECTTAKSQLYTENWHLRQQRIVCQKKSLQVF